MLLDSVDLYLKCIGFFFIPLNIVNAYRNGLQGLGYGLLPMTAGGRRAGRPRGYRGHLRPVQQLFRHLHGRAGGVGSGH